MESPLDSARETQQIIHLLVERLVRCEPVDEEHAWVVCNFPGLSSLSQIVPRQEADGCLGHARLLCEHVLLALSLSPAGARVVRELAATVGY